jgi:hypothetical protein
MPINLDKRDRWDQDIRTSVDRYNRWFVRYAPEVFRRNRIRTARVVKRWLRATLELRDIGVSFLKDHPRTLEVFRMATSPPVARDRLIGLSGVRPTLVKGMEKEGRFPSRGTAKTEAELRTLAGTIAEMLDQDLFPWLARGDEPTSRERNRAATIIADRLCGARANPIVRNAQEKRLQKKIAEYLGRKGYRKVIPTVGQAVDQMEPGTYHFIMRFIGTSVRDEGSAEDVAIPIDIAIQPLGSRLPHLPVMIEAKSAGDYANPNKRRKEEATKVKQLRAKHGPGVQFILFLCGYFNKKYLTHSAADGIDWIWEHRIADLDQIGI